MSPSDFNRALGAVIRAHRTAAGLTLGVAARRVSREWDGTNNSVTPVALRTWECGTRSVSVERFDAVARAIGIDPGGALATAMDRWQGPRAARVRAVRTGVNRRAT
jgi:transcriptional regulator with XRE-family HTH domain